MTRITVPCAYCMQPVRVELKGFETRYREVVLISFGCPHCDSTTELYMGSRRKRKGKRAKAESARKERVLKEKIAASISFADVAASKLLKQKGCACATRKLSSYDYYGDQRSDGLVNVTTPGGIKLVPRHHTSCPVAGTDIEASLRETLGDALNAQLAEKENAA